MAEKSTSNLDDTEPSLTTVTTDCDKVGGYNCSFAESPADDLLCKICHYPAHDPILAVCCGHSFCSYCLERYHQSKVIDHSSCPYCREEKFQTVPDKRTGHYVLNLKVFCPHKHQGCEWIGELRSMEDHVNKSSNNNIGCLFTELQCSNGCGVVIQRRLVKEHLKSECELRKVNCEYCNTKGSYQWINSSHQEECPKYPVECPNHCEVGLVRREKMGGHLEECPLAIVECPYAAVGCESVIRRKEHADCITMPVEQSMEYNKNAISDTQNELKIFKSIMNERLDDKEQELASIKRDLMDTRKELQAVVDRLFVKEQELENVRVNLQDLKNDTRDKLKESQEIQSQLKMAITEKGRELDEVRKKPEENNKTLWDMIQQLKDKLEGTEQSLQQQLKVNSQLQLQVEATRSLTWTLWLNQCAENNDKIIPAVIKLPKFTVHKSSNVFNSPGFYTSDVGYKLCLRVYPNGGGNDYFYRYGNSISVGAFLMKGDYDDSLSWPYAGTLGVQLLNQLDDSSHSDSTKLYFNGRATNCRRVFSGDMCISGSWAYNCMRHRILYYDANRKCQYLKNDCLFFRVTLITIANPAVCK